MRHEHPASVPTGHSRAVRRAAPRRRGTPFHPLRGAPKMRLGARGRSATLRGAP
jgi:hypothetical protein